MAPVSRPDFYFKKGLIRFQISPDCGDFYSLEGMMSLATDYFVEVAYQGFNACIIDFLFSVLDLLKHSSNLSISKRRLGADRFSRVTVWVGFLSYYLSPREVCLGASVLLVVVNGDTMVAICGGFANRETDTLPCFGIYAWI